MTVKKFLFDLGNVFFDWNPERVLKPIFNDDERMNFFINNISFPLLDTRCDFCKHFYAYKKWLGLSRRIPTRI